MCIIFPLLTTQLGYHLLCVSIVFFFLFLVLFFFVVVLIQTTFKLCGIVWQYFVCVLFAIRNWCASECDCVLWRTLLPGLLIVFNIGYGFC